MKSILKITAIAALCLVCACTTSNSDKKKAKETYDIVCYNVSEITKADSSFAACIQFFMKEMQKPITSENDTLEKMLSDSIDRLNFHIETLEKKLSQAQTEFDTLNTFDNDINIVNFAKELCKTYQQTIDEEYSTMVKKLSTYSFPVDEKEYVDILDLSYNADSTLNEKVSNLNVMLNEFAGKYKFTKASSN